MGNEEIYTVEEVAKLLKVSKLTVYDLIKKGELEAYRVGRQMRIEGMELEKYKQRGREGGAAETRLAEQSAPAAERSSQIVISGQDPCMDLLSRELEGKGAARPLRSQNGSLDGLVAMYRGEADIVSTHLFDGDTKQYNIPYIRKLLVSQSFIVLHYINREAGLFVAKGNPKGITGWRDLAKGGIIIANRETGAGARVLLDEQLRLAGIERSLISGYDSVHTSHLAVAGAVAAGRADAGVGISRVAGSANVDFVPLITEQYDIVLLRTARNEELVRNVLDLLKSKDLQDELASIGYDTRGMGDVLYEQ